jgi:hypothetical protein
MITDEYERRETTGEERPCDLKSAFNILHYNQNLVQLADSKAGNLIVINSIFLASITSFVMETKPASRIFSGFEGTFVIFFFAATVAAILYCLRIIMTKGTYYEGARHLDLIFFGDIAQKTTPENYIFDFIKIKPKEFLADILRRTYTTAQIADRKFSYTKTAQTLTVLSSILWLINILCLFMRQ